MLVDTSNEKQDGYPTVVRWLHFAMASGALFQLLTSLILLPPDEKGSPFAHTVMQAHEVGGLFVAVFVAIHLVLSLISKKDQHSSMRVLFDVKYWCEAFSLVKLLPIVLLGKTNMIESGNSLARIVSMLGVLLMMAMGATGIAIWFGLPEHGTSISHNVDMLMDIHSMLSNLLWVYIFGHVFMVFAHMRVGEQVIKRISPFH